MPAERDTAAAPGGVAAHPVTDAVTDPVTDPVADTVIACEGLVKRFGDVTALDGVDLTVRRGDVTVLLGLSGSGKSTLLRVLNGAHMATEGSVEVLGTDLTTASQARLRGVRRRVGFVFQQFHLVGPVTVLENVCSGALGRLRMPRLGLGSYPRAIRFQALDQLERVGLAAQAFQRADTLSGGQQQRVAIARALLQQPEVMLADEPVASLDPESSRQVMTLLREIAEDQGITIVCSLHQLEIARAWSDRIVGLRGGRVVLDAPTTTVTQEAAMAVYGDLALGTPARTGRRDAAGAPS